MGLPRLAASGQDGQRRELRELWHSYIRIGMELMADKTGSLKLPSVGKPGERWEWRSAGDGIVVLVRNGGGASYLSPPSLTSSEARALFSSHPQAEAIELHQACANSTRVAGLHLAVEDM